MGCVGWAWGTAVTHTHTHTDTGHASLQTNHGHDCVTTKLHVDQNTKLHSKLNLLEWMCLSVLFAVLKCFLLVCVCVCASMCVSASLIPQRGGGSVSVLTINRFSLCALTGCDWLPPCKSPSPRSMCMRPNRTPPPIHGLTT